jgi:acetyl esterase/lipase
MPNELFERKAVERDHHASRNGAWLSFVRDVEGVACLFLSDLTGGARGEARLLVRGVGDHWWEPGDGGPWIRSTDPDRPAHVYTVDLESGALNDMTPIDGAVVSMAGTSAGLPGWLFLELASDDESQSGLFRYELATGNLDPVGAPPDNCAAWNVDSRMRLRSALVLEAGLVFELVTRADEATAWSKVLEWDETDLVSGASTVGFTADDTRLLVIDPHGSDLPRLLSVDARGGDPLVVFSTPEAAVVGALLHPDTGALLAVRFGAERFAWRALDPAVRPILDIVAKRTDCDCNLSPVDGDLRFWLATFEHPSRPVRTYLVDSREDREVLVHDPLAELADYEAADSTTFAFAGADGTRLTGYLSFPKDQPRSNLPLVVVPHGGPWARALWGYDVQLPWLTSRGYVCLTLNHRGSTGFGRAFTQAGYGEWVDVMLADVAAAIRWAVAEGIADRERVAVHGGSYGGHVAVGLTIWHPDLIRCAVSINGPLDLATLVRKNSENIWLGQFLPRVVGDPEVDADELRAQSPARRGAEVRVPLLVAQGGLDPFSDPADTEAMVDAVRAAGIECEYYLYPEEAHGIEADPRSAIELREHVERFLARHIGGAVTPEAPTYQSTAE